MRIISSPRVTDVMRYERNPNSWILEQMTRGVADMSSHSLVLTPDSEKDVEYSVAIGAFRPQIYFKAQSLRRFNNIYLIPLSFDTWVALLSILLVITVVLTYILARETKLPHQTPYDLIARIADEKSKGGINWDNLNPDKIHARERWEVSEILLVTGGAMCQQGTERDPSTAAARTLLLSLFIMSVLVATSYAASLISLISLLPETDKELHGWAPGNRTKILLQDTNFFRYHPEINKAKVSFTTLENGLASVVDETETAFIADRDVSLTTLHSLRFGPDEKCTIARAFSGLEYQRVFAIRLNSTIKAAINYNILKLRQHGILSRESRNLFNRQPPCTANERSQLSGFVSVDLSDTIPALKFLFYGIISAGLLLLVEYVVFYSCEKIKETLGQAWRIGEDHAGNVLNRWTRQKLYKEFQQKKENEQGFVFEKPIVSQKSQFEFVH